MFGVARVFKVARVCHCPSENLLYNWENAPEAAQAGFKEPAGFGLSCVPEKRNNSNINSDSDMITFSVQFTIGTGCVTKGKMNNQFC